MFRTMVKGGERVENIEPLFETDHGRWFGSDWKPPRGSRETLDDHPPRKFSIVSSMTSK